MAETLPVRRDDDEDLPKRRRKRTSETLVPATEPNDRSTVPQDRQVAVWGEDGQEGILEGEKLPHPRDEFDHWDAILDAVHEEFITRSRLNPGGPEAVKEEETYYGLVNDVVIEQHSEWGIKPIELSRLVELLRQYQFGYGALEPYMILPGLEELYFNRYDQGFYIVDGQKHRITEAVFTSQKELAKFVDRVALENELEINLQSPALDATLKDGSRLNATIEPLAVDGPDFVIRKHRDIPFTVEQLLAGGTISEELAEDLERWVKGGLNIVVSGGTSSGKTSLLNTIGNAFIPSDDRVLVLENRKELQIQTEDTKYFQTREDASRDSNDASDITIQDLIRYTLRKRPDRIIVGEVRGREAYYALVSWNSGHDGSFCTVHANSAGGAIKKLEMLARGAGELDQEGIRALIADAVDIVIQVRRVPHSARREIVEVAEVLHSDKYDVYNEKTQKKVEKMLEDGTIRQQRGDVWLLPLYRRSDGQLKRMRDALPLEGKTV